MMNDETIKKSLTNMVKKIKILPCDDVIFLIEKDVEPHLGAVMAQLVQV